jgi:hypothetical protein
LRRRVWLATTATSWIVVLDGCLFMIHGSGKLLFSLDGWCKWWIVVLVGLSFLMVIDKSDGLLFWSVVSS